MGLLQRIRRDEGRPPPDEAPLADEAPEPQPEHREPRLRDPGPTELSKRDYLAILKRSLKEANRDHITNLAAALAYYAFLAIPSALLIAAGVFSLLAGPHAVSTIIDKLGTIIPGQAQTLLDSSLRRMTEHQATGALVAGIGGGAAPLAARGAGAKP